MLRNVSNSTGPGVDSQKLRERERESERDRGGGGGIGVLRRGARGSCPLPLKLVKV